MPCPGWPRHRHRHRRGPRHPGGAPRTRSMTPDADTPGSVTRKTWRRPVSSPASPTAATSSGRASMAPTPNRIRSRSWRSSARSASDGMSADLEDGVGGGVAPHGQPAAATRRVEPALGRGAVRVLEHPDLVEVALVGIGDRCPARRVAPRRTRTRPASDGHSAGRRACASARPRRALVGQDVILAEAREGERRDQGGRPPGRDQLGHALAAGGDRLEPPGAPSRS